MSEEFSPGLKILLERIREFPEDFLEVRSGMLYNDAPSWGDLVNEVMREGDTFTREEQKAVRDALRYARRTRFDGAVMDLLVKKPKEPEPESYRFKTGSRYAQQLGASMVATQNVAQNILSGTYQDPTHYRKAIK